MQVYSFHDFIVKEVTMTEDLKIVEYIRDQVIMSQGENPYNHYNDNNDNDDNNDNIGKDYDNNY